MVKEAFGEVEEQEDEHLYPSTGWGRELWIASLGLPAVLPPPEEEKGDANTCVPSSDHREVARGT